MSKHAFFDYDGELYIQDDGITRWRQEWDIAYSEFQGSSDRATVILGAALLGGELADIIRAFLVDDARQVDLLLAPERPLGTFGARIKGAYCLGLISTDEHHDLDIIRKIRNRFAHDVRASFQDSSVIDRCANLRMPNRMPIHGQTSTARDALKHSIGVLHILLSTQVTVARRKRGLLSHAFLGRDLETGLVEEYRAGNLEFISSDAGQAFGQELCEENVPDAYKRGFLTFSDGNKPREEMQFHDLTEEIPKDFENGRIAFVSPEASEAFGEPLTKENVFRAFMRGFAEYVGDATATDNL